MRLLVTGGCGFVGSNFLRYVLQHYGPEMITNVDSLVSGMLGNVDGLATTFGERYEFLRADIENTDKIDPVLAMHAHFGVVNFASESATGSAGAGSLIELARKHGVRRFLQVSNSAAGDLGDGMTGSPNIQHQAGADDVVLDEFRAHREEVVLTRSARNYGPFQSPRKLIPRWIISALRDEPLSVPGDGATQRGWLHVEDHCSGIFAALLRGEPGAIYYLPATQMIPDIEIAHAVLDQLGKSRSVIRFSTSPGKPEPVIANGFPSAEDTLEWKPRTNFTDGLRATIDWYIHNREWWEAQVVES